MTSFICQISEKDWLTSRKIGVYGNREGSERNGKTIYFSETRRGDTIIQSIVEDLIGMRRGDVVFFHVIEAEEGESSIHGIYRVTEEPFFNSSVVLWHSNPNLVYPYRFCFGPHPDHVELCRYDANILVSEFYRAIESREIRSILTLEREVRGAAHAVKTITTEDAEAIVKLLYKGFHIRRSKEHVDFEPTSMHMQPLRQHIERIGEIEFAIKALMAYHLGRTTPDIMQYFPACRDGDFDFLIETFIGQTMRRPTDILCIETGDGERKATVIEGKTRGADMNDFIQSLRYLELYRLRNVDRGSLLWDISVCLLAQRFNRELAEYISIRNIVIPWERTVLLRYTPTQNGRDAVFSLQTSSAPTILALPSEPRIEAENVARILRNPEELFLLFNRRKTPRTHLELEFSDERDIILARHFVHEGDRAVLGRILIHMVSEPCTVQCLAEFMRKIREEANKFQGDFLAVKPIIIANSFDASAKFFIEEYNRYETHAKRQPISAYAWRARSGE